MKDGMGSIFVWYIHLHIRQVALDNSAVMDIYVRIRSFFCLVSESTIVLSLSRDGTDAPLE